jgi:hypothetical protein
VEGLGVCYNLLVGQALVFIFFSSFAGALHDLLLTF